MAAKGKEIIYIGGAVIGIVVVILAAIWDMIVGAEIHLGSIQLLGMNLGTILAIAGVVMFASEKAKAK